MPYTPVDLRHVKVGRALFGYDRGTVEQVLDDVADSFEETWRERGELTDKVHELEKRVTELRSREDLLTNTLVAAEAASAEIKDRATREAELILTEARHEARQIVRTAQNERERLFSELHRAEAALRGALGMLDEAAKSRTTEQEPAKTPAEHAEPVRIDDTRDIARPFAISEVAREPEAHAG